jgi:hypothetical protein
MELNQRSIKERYLENPQIFKLEHTSNNLWVKEEISRIRKRLNNILESRKVCKGV